MAGQLVQVRGEEKRTDSGFKSKPNFTEANSRCLDIILASGFGCRTGYAMSRDRHYVHLNEGVSRAQLLAFCEAELNGAPIPDDGPTRLSLFKKAEAAGLVKHQFVEARKAFVPEMGSL